MTKDDVWILFQSAVWPVRPFERLLLQLLFVVDRRADGTQPRSFVYREKVLRVYY